MPRYFLELSYKGTAYSGFQSQLNANTIQNEVEKAFGILQKQKPVMTGSSRTDAGVHALQNFFHFDYEGDIHPHFMYKMNAILPNDIVIRGLYPVAANAHCRYDAESRLYQYYIYRRKDAFLRERAFYFPYKVDLLSLEEAAMIVKQNTDFTSFSKRKTQVKTFECKIFESEWISKTNCLIYRVRANRFVRGMVRALVATMLSVGRSKINMAEFKEIIQAKDCNRTNFAAPAKGLFLRKVEFPAGIIEPK